MVSVIIEFYLIFKSNFNGIFVKETYKEIGLEI